MERWNRNTHDDLRRIGLIEGVSATALDALAAAATYREYGKDAFISGPGYVCPDVCLIHAGSIRCTRTSEGGKQVQMTGYGAGDTYGLHHVTSSRDDESYALSGPVGADLYHIDARRFRSILATEPHLALRVVDELVQRLRRAHDRIETLALFDVRGRVERQLIRLAGASADRTVTATQKELALMIGASREEVSKAIKELRRAGLIEPAATPGRLTLTATLLSPAA